MPALNPNMALPVDLMWLAGQSNASGTPGAYQNPPAPSTTTGRCWDYRATGGTTFVQVSDPNSSDTTYRANNGSLVPSFVNTFTEASGRSIVVVRTARGGTALLAANNQPLGNGHWDIGGNCFPDSVTRILAAKAEIEALGHTVGRIFGVWSQGGRDAQGGQDLELYEAANAALISRWRTALGVPDAQVFMEELSSVQGGEGALADEIALIRAAQNSACLHTEGLHMAFNEGKDYVNRPGWMRPSDGIHYMQVGLNYMGYKMALYAADYYGLSLDPVDPPVEAADIRTSRAGHRLWLATALPTLPRTWYAAGTYTWQCPWNVTAIKLEGWGAGGGGRGGVGLGRGGMGGGSGEYRIIASLAVTPGATYTITIGAGGNGSTYNSNDGTNGADVTVTGPGGTIMIAKGGLKPPSASTTGAGGSGGTGGVGTNGNAGGISVNTSGSDGAAGGNAPNGGLGGAGGTAASILGKPGLPPGGGGGGGKGNVAGAHGGAGAPGGVRISTV